MAILPYLHPSISTALMRPRRPKQYCLQLVIYIYIYIYFFFFAGKSFIMVFFLWSRPKPTSMIQLMVQALECQK